MDNRSYEAPRGYIISTVLLECVHCHVVVDASLASRHRLEHSIEQSRDKGSGKRQCSCTPGQGISPTCRKHGAYTRRFRRTR